MDKTVVEFTHRNETKGTHRYEEVEQGGKPPVVGGLYLKKYALPSTPPRRLRVTIEEV